MQELIVYKSSIGSGLLNHFKFLHPLNESS